MQATLLKVRRRFNAAHTGCNEKVSPPALATYRRRDAHTLGNNNNRLAKAVYPAALF